MSKLTLTLLALIFTTTLTFQIHHADFNIDQLTDQQNNAQDWLWDTLDGKLDGSTLIAGQQVGNTYTYRYLGSSLPRTLTDYTVSQLTRDNGEKYYQIDKAVSSSTVGGLEDGSRVTTIKSVTRGNEVFEDAAKIAGW